MCEEWMITSDLHTPFEDADDPSTVLHNQHQDRQRYTDQEIGDMTPWIKTKREQSANGLHESHEAININSFSEMQEIAFDIVNNHLYDAVANKEPLCMIIIGPAGTGKSYLINGLPNLLQTKGAFNATTGKAPYNIRVITIQSLLKLPVGPKSNKDFTGESLCRLQQSLKDIRYILINENSMLGQSTFGWIEERWKKATGCYD